MNTYKFYVELTNGASLEVVKACFPHQRNKFLSDVAYDLISGQPYGICPDVKVATTKKVADGVL